MKKIIIVVAVVAVVGGGAYYLISGRGSGLLPASSTPTPTVPALGTFQTTTASSVTININNYTFNPPVLNIKTGTKVTWVNNDSSPHTITSDSGNLLHSLNLSPGQSFSFTFTSAGTVNYHCSLHPTMKGSIVVGK